MVNSALVVGFDSLVSAKIDTLTIKRKVVARVHPSVPVICLPPFGSDRIKRKRGAETGTPGKIFSASEIADVSKDFQSNVKGAQGPSSTVENG
jgi:hypothetical protein